MAKRSKRKNVILTNLPAALALILMAAALKITLKFSFFVSLLILLVIYFILGVLIELILDKMDTKKKKEDLFKKYAEGKSGQLPAFSDGPEEDEIEYEVKPQKEADEVSEKVRRTVAVGSLYDTEETESPAFMRKEEGASAEPSPVKEEEIPEKAIELPRNSETVSGPEPEPAEELRPEQKTESVSGAAAAHDEGEEDSVPDMGISEPADEPWKAFEPDESFVRASAEESDGRDADTEIAENVQTESENAKEAESEEADTETEPEETSSAVAEEIEAEPVSDADTDEAAQIVQPAVMQEAEAEEGTAEVLPETSEARTSEKIPEVSEADEELIEALKDVGAIQEDSPEDVPAEEAEARRSLFDETDDFDAGFAERVKKNTSIIFGSVPDTEDDFEYIPVSDSSEPPVTTQKGKVKVDSKKIDDLYSFKKGKSGEKFFGRRKR